MQITDEEYATMRARRNTLACDPRKVAVQLPVPTNPSMTSHWATFIEILYISPETATTSLQQHITMRFANITAAFALFLAGVSALEKPLDIKVEHAVECSRKTKRGEALFIAFGAKTPC